MKKLKLFILLLIPFVCNGQWVVNASPPGPYTTGAYYSDDFESSSDGTYLYNRTGWSQEMNLMIIKDNSGDKRVNPGTSSDDVACYYSGGTFDGDHYSKAVIESLSSYARIGVAVRCQGSNGETFYAWCSNTTDSRLWREDSGTRTELAAADRGDPWSASDIVELRIVGYELQMYRNGSLDTSIDGDGKYEDTSGSKLDGGWPGVAGYENSTDADLDDWEGGDL